MRRFAVLMLGALSVTLAAARPALPWGSAVHAYIAAELGEKGILSKNVVYGSVAPDTFNFMFDLGPDQQKVVYALTHGFDYPDPLMGFWTIASSGNERQRALGRGFLSHNNLYNTELSGADTAAHGNPYNNPANGYVIAKAVQLASAIAPQLPPDMPLEVLIEVSHILVEYGCDLLLRKADRSIGASLISAASARDSSFPELLVRAYAGPMAWILGQSPQQAAARIRFEEESFRKLTIEYGKALQKGDSEAFKQVAGMLAMIAPAYLAAYGFDIPGELLGELIWRGLAGAMELCRGDLMAAVGDTVALVETNLQNLP